ncbi:MAG: phosphodiesterase [Oscillospiraceae bacterium]|nr:phosphodiesterase [Oscillospiraceae bacterium]
MKLMTASDIHGSAFYCSKLLEALEREGADRLLLLGDILYHGPRNALPQGYAPKETAEMLNGIKQKIFCIRGNCDAEVDQMMLEFPIMSDFCVLALGRRLIYATHGHRYSLASPPPLQRGDILLHGHTHVPTWERFGEDNICLNPGSVSIPKSGSERGYMLLEGDAAKWKTLDGSVYHSESLG